MEFDFEKTYKLLNEKKRLLNEAHKKSIDEYKMKIQEQYKQAKEIYDTMDKKTTVKEIDELITKLHEIEERIKRYKKFLIIIENSYDLPTVDKTDDKTNDKKDKGEKDTTDNKLFYYFYVDDSDDSM